MHNLLNRIRGSEIERNIALRQLAQNDELRAKIYKYVRSNSGDKDDFQMVLTDTLIAFTKQVIKSKDFTFSTNYMAYLIGISKYVWAKHLRERKPEFANDEILKNYEDQDISIFQKIVNNENKNTIHQILHQLGKNCKEVLLLWANKYSMKEIASQLGYKSDGMAKKKKFMCIKEMTQYFEEHSITPKYFGI